MTTGSIGAQPAGAWPSVRCAGPTALLLHGAGAELQHYEAAIQAAEMGRRVLVIECSSAMLEAWVPLVRAAPHRPSTMVIVPRGGVHPLPLRREAMQ